MYAASDVDELLTCPICLDKITNGKMLPCQHTFCTVCLIGVMELSPNGNNPRNPKITCPQCRVSHKVPRNGIQGFKENIVVNQMLGLRKAKCHECTSGGDMTLCHMCYFHRSCSCHDQDCRLRLPPRQELFQPNPVPQPAAVSDLPAVVPEVASAVDRSNDPAIDYAGKFRGWKQFIGGSRSAEKLKQPSGVAYYADTNEIFVADRAECSIKVYKPGGKSNGAIAIGVVVCPNDLCTNDNGCLFITDHDGQRIVCYDLDDNFVKRYIFYDHGTPTELVGIACDSHAIFAVDRRNSCVRVYDAHTGDHLRHFGARYLREPNYITIGPDRKVYITDNANHEVCVFNFNGSFCRSFGKREGYGAAGITVDNEGYVSVARPLFHTIDVYRPDGQLLCSFGNCDQFGREFPRADEKPGNLCEPQGLDLMPNGKLIVAEAGNHRLQIF